MVTTLQLFLAFLALLALERLLELWLTRRNAARAFVRGGREVGQRHYKAMVLFHALFLVAPAAEVLWLDRPFPGVLGFVALGVALAAQALRYWAIATLKDRWSSRIIVLPDVPPVTAGPYRYLRHPNYVAVILEIAAVPLIHGAWLTALIFSVGNAALLLVRIRTEERALGPAWEAAFGRRPRFIPEVRRG